VAVHKTTNECPFYCHFIRPGRIPANIGNSHQNFQQKYVTLSDVQTDATKQANTMHNRLLKNLKFDIKYVIPKVTPKKYSKGFFLGQVVLIKNPKILTLKKGMLKFEGPYVVHARVGVNSYKVTHMATGVKVKFVINGRRMSPYTIDRGPVILKKETGPNQRRWIDITGMKSAGSYAPPSRVFNLPPKSRIPTTEHKRLNTEAEKFLRRTNNTNSTGRVTRSSKR
jgi:hypothetical protein